MTNTIDRIKVKIALLLVMLLGAMFFSTDFGLIDIEKTAIITAVAIDKEGEEIVATVEIAVPEPTDKQNENPKIVSGRGKTIGGALKDIGNLTGWYPQLIFCNLIVLGDSIKEENAIKVVDYFSKTLRVQDSALLVKSDKKASELLNKTTPLDSVSSFAIQKTILKAMGFDKNVIRKDIKSFCADYYSLGKSSMLPIIKVIDSEEGANKSGTESDSESLGEGSSGENNKAERDKIYMSNNTALYVNGIVVGELNKEQTLTYNAIKGDITYSTFNVESSDNYLMTIEKNNSDISLSFNKGLNVDITLNIKCKISDQNGEYQREQEVNENIDSDLKRDIEEYFTDRINEIIEVQNSTKCDILNITEQMYRYNYNKYKEYKEKVFTAQYNVTVNVL